MEYYIARDCIMENNVKIWTLQNAMNGRYVRADNDQVKLNMRKNKIDVANLTLTSDDRLIRASEYKFEAFNAMLQAPEQIRNNLRLVPKEYSDRLETSVDRAIEQSLKTYTSEYGKYCVLKETDGDKNLLAAKFRVGVDTFIIAKYQKIVFGQANDSQDVYFDILVGIEAIKCGSLFEYIKAVPSRLSQYAAEHYSYGGDISDELYCTHTHGITNDYFTLHATADKTTVKGSFELDTEDEKLFFAHAIMRALADQMDEVIINNPDLVNNVDIGQLVAYDEAEAHYIQMGAAAAGITLAGALVIGAITATSLIVNPSILQTGLLAKIAGTGTPQQILSTIKGMAVAGGGITGGVASAGITYSAFNRSMSNAKLNMQAAKPGVGPVKNVEFENANRSRRARIRSSAEESGLL